MGQGTLNWEYVMMSKNFGKPNWITTLLTGFLLLTVTNSAYAQFGTVQQIGGIEVNAGGVLGEVTQQMQADVRQKVLESLASVSDDAKQSTGMRSISMKALEKALQDAANGTSELTDEIRFMAGIQRIQYVIVQPENNDILIVGPGEGWTVDQAGNVVGETTGRPVIRFEDFIVALRTADAANRDYGITVSIDPTPEGQKRLNRLYRQGGFSPDMKQAVEEAMGPQNISLTGMPTDSRMAQILVAADYRMKRMAMGFQSAPVPGLPSLLEMAQRKGKGFNQDPRFWLQCSYESIKRSSDGNVWQIDGPGAKALTETQAANGSKAKDHPLAKQWAENMTEHFAALADADPVFAELQNVMDMAVVAAILRKHDLLVTAGLSIPTVSGENDQVPLPKWSVPETVSSQCSFVKIKNSWMITVSGGVQVDSWSVLDSVQIDDAVAEVAKRVSRTDEKNLVWWDSAK